MLGTLPQRLLPLLQLTRMALVFTAIADGWCSLLLAARMRAGASGNLWHHVSATQVCWAAAVSAGLYGFGMSLNDIIDRRRDEQIAATRPLPSGRLGIATAHVVCAALLLVALTGGTFYSLGQRSPNWMSLVLVLWTAMLVVFYDVAGKYLVAPGLLTLGLIRFFHALVPAPHVPLLWHPLLLLSHVTVLSTVAYHWEQKRPPLTRAHWLAVFGGLAVIDAAAIAFVASRHDTWRATPLRLGPEILAPVLAVAAFALVAWYVRRTSANSREAGQRLMLYGLLWLILYDVCFVAAYVRDWAATLGVLLLLPVAYFSVRLMRWWSKIVTLSQKPQFKRAQT